jgi:hypothetical protein
LRLLIPKVLEIFCSTDGKGRNPDVSLLQNEEQKKEEIRKEKRKEYIEQRKIYIDLQHEMSQSLDTKVITLAGGALGLSFTFIRQVVPQAKPETVLFLGAAWICLVAALLATLLSVFTSQVGMIKALEELDKAYGRTQPILRGFLAKLYAWVANGFTTIFGWPPLTQYLNISAILLTTVGLGLLAYFGVQNISLVQVPLK